MSKRMRISAVTRIHRVAISLCQRLRDQVLIRVVAGGQDLRRIRFGQEGVDDVEEALKVSILEIIPDGDESYGNSGRDTDSILNIEVLSFR